MKDKLLSFVVLPSIMFALFLAFSPVGRVEAVQGGVPAETCPPTGGDWVKIDSLSGTSYPYIAPAGKLVAEVCYKASTTVNYYDVIPNMQTVLVVSTVMNPQGNAIQDLSHASFRLIDEPEEEMCEWDETIPADDDDCQEPEEEMCEWNEEIPADDDDCLPPVVSCVETSDGPIVWGP